jgi:hypothetical protein
LRLGSQFPAQIHPAFPGQHPIQDQKWEACRGQGRFSFFGGGDSCNFMAPLGDESLQVPPASRVIFDEQNVHFRRSQTASSAGVAARGRPAPLERSELCWFL